MSFQEYLDKIGEYGIVKEVRHPIALISGLPNAKPHEIVIFEDGVKGEVFGIEKDLVEIMVFSKEPVRVLTRLVRTDTYLAVPVHESLLGRTIDPMGNALDGSKIPKITEWRDIESDVLNLSQRHGIHTPLATGVTLIDMLIPLGKGQKQLVIGDRKTGKTALLLSAMKRQYAEGTIIIYAAIARKKSDIKRLQDYITQEKMNERTVLIATSSSDSPSLIYLTPYSAMTLAEYFRDMGKNVLVILDDLSTHAKFYREIALLAKRFPGRDSYPGDIFYIHSKLIERAGNFKHARVGEVSISCLPVAEIVEGDLTGYIATNIMGMTDGHIYFDANSYYQGRRPAINVALSVTRVGKQTQNQLKSQINNELSSFLAHYEKLQQLSHFGAELSEKVKNVLARGEKVYELFDQHYREIIPEEIQIILYGLVWSNAVGSTPQHDTVTQIRTKMLLAYAEASNIKIFQQIASADSLYNLLINLTKHKEELKTICKININ